MGRFWKIIATLWPAISTKWILKQMDKYVDIYRINLSHADLFKTRQIIKNIRDINSKKVFMLDTKWPEIRTTNKEKTVEKWQIIKVFSKPTEDEISFEYDFFKNIPTEIEISFDDNAVKGIVISNNWDFLEVEIIQWWTIWYNKTVNFKWYEIELDFLTEKDKKDIAFGVEEDIALLAVSFVKTAEDIIRLKEYIKENFDWFEMKIIAKIETVSAVNDIDNIIKVSDGIMIARWDLWANIDLIELPKIQKEIIKKCNLAWKPVILATQVMSSMTNNPTPTRAEIDEVAYNLQSWVDLFMLSNETAVGKYPVETVQILNDIIVNYQDDIYIKLAWEDIKNYVSKENEITDYILYNAKKMAYKLGVKFIITPTSTGYTPSRIASLKPTIPIIAFTDDDKVFKYCNMLFGTTPHKISPENMEYEKFKKVVWETLQKDYRWKIKGEDRILIVHSSIASNVPWMINWIEVIKFKDL